MTRKYELYNADCLDQLAKMDPVKCIFADPPDNQKLGYDECEDNLTPAQYIALLERWVNAFVDKAEIVWLSFNARWTIPLGSILFRLPSDRYEVKANVQVFTFGQHNKHDLGNNHRPLWRIMRKGAKLYPDQIKVESWRQRNGDKRAAPGGRVPGDVFDMQYPVDEAKLDTKIEELAQQLASINAMSVEAASRAIRAALREFQIQPGDVFDFPRVTGNSAQRCDWHPTQLHEELVKRCVLLSTAPTDRTVDPFGGTGTTLRVCKEIGRPCTLIEMSPNYCANIAAENGLLSTRSLPHSWVGSK